MDRNVTRGQLPTPEPPVALRKESVDRNLSALAVWPGLLAVALRKESVDRNTFKIRITAIDSMSLSARRAWIEMFWELPSKAGVFLSRSPQGERG